MTTYELTLSTNDLFGPVRLNSARTRIEEVYYVYVTFHFLYLLTI